MFGWKKSQKPIPQYAKPSERKVALRRDEIVKLMRHRQLSSKELALIEPLYGVLSYEQQQDFRAKLGWSFKTRLDQRKVSKQYRKLYKEFHMKGLAKDLASRKARIDAQTASLEKQLKKKRKSEDSAQKPQIALMENLVRHLQTLYPQLTEIRDQMYMIYQMAQLWETAECEGLSQRHSLDSKAYAYDSEDTAQNVAYLKELRKNLVLRELKLIDGAIEALIERGPGVLAVLGEVKGLHAEAKKSIARTQTAMKGRSLTAMDRTAAADHIDNLKKQAAAFAGMSERAEEAAKMLSGEMKSFKPFVKTVAPLHKDLQATKKAFHKGKKQENYFVSLIQNLDKRTLKINQAATASTRLWLLSQLVGPNSVELSAQLMHGKTKAVRDALEADVYFREFTSVVSGSKGNAAFPKEGVQVMIKDYPYQVRDFCRDLKKVFKSVHSANQLFLKQVSGASGKEEPDYIDNFENYIEARSKTIGRFKDETAQGIIREHFPDNSEDENKMWVKVLDDLIIKEMIASNDKRRP